ncbi:MULTISPECIES: YbaN family protein [Pseudoalteromonas]|uniref:Inner membrane protein n=2 Tax=Pseudoalteromonas TaxID=53246 RepID=A0A4Q7EMG7_9GAMM|nr:MULTISPECIES: YbaN family protein [Pseudoalteromonas]QTL36401.1 YbaN family protein [Pseudoalteromonas viridis]RZM84908.1 DUF454 domain-containing protein [Pseudoalteromonas rubra]
MKKHAQKLFNRCFWLHLAGILCVALGFIGMALPVMPTTIFFILALACFTRSNPKLANWLLAHPKFGPTLHAWHTHQVVPVKGKWGAGLGMLLGFILLCMTTAPWYVLLGVALTELLVMAYLLSKPSELPVSQ